jgi:hypothetical protein
MIFDASNQPIMIIINTNRIVDLTIKGVLIIFIIAVALPVRIINSLPPFPLKGKAIGIGIFCLLLLLVGVQNANAQRFKKFLNTYQIGLEGSFGIKSFTVSSDIKEINDLYVVGEGGTIGIIWGSNAVVGKIRQGYYYSASSVAHTVDEIRSALAFNFYPNYLFNPESSFRPYVVMGAERSNFHMHGYYDRNDESVRNHSRSEDPYLGKISTIQVSIGGGIEYRIKNPGHFVALFGEAKYGKAVTSSSNNPLFEQTRLSGQLLVSVGVGFGYYR